MANWLVTGGCGFIGSALVRRLLAADEAVRVFDDLSVGTRDALPAEFFQQTQSSADWNETNSLVVGDIRDASAMADACTGAEIIVHLAANTGVGPSVEDPRLDCEKNVLGTLNVLEGARQAGTRRIVFASSGAPLAGNVPPLHEDMAPMPLSPYGASKLAGEGYMHAYAGTFGLETVILRFGNVYGPGSGHKSSVVAAFIKRALNGLPLEIYGDGTQTRDFIFLDDLLSVIHLSGTVPLTGSETFQLATNSETSVGEIAEIVRVAIKSSTGRTVEIRYADARRGDAQRNYSDVSKAQEWFGFKPQFSLRTGIQRTLDYFLDHSN